MRAAQGIRLGHQTGVESGPVCVLAQRVGVHPGASVDLFDGQRHVTGHVDGGAIGGFERLRADRLDLQLEVTRATALAELAGLGQATGKGVVAVPQQIGGRAHTTGFGR